MGEVQDKNIKEGYRLLLDLPAFLRAATPPWRFIPVGLGLAARPFDVRQSSRREPRGPCVEIRSDFFEPSASTSIESE